MIYVENPNRKKPWTRGKRNPLKTKSEEYKCRNHSNPNTNTPNLTIAQLQPKDRISTHTHTYIQHVPKSEHPSPPLPPLNLIILFLQVTTNFFPSQGSNQLWVKKSSTKDLTVRASKCHEHTSHRASATKTQQQD